MKASDLARLSELYPEGDCSTNDRVMPVLGHPMRRWKELEALI